LVAALAYGRPLWQLGRLALGHDLYSYVLIVPLVSAFMVWTRGAQLPAATRPDGRAAAGLGMLGALLLALVAVPAAAADPLGRLSLAVLSFVAVLAALGAWFLGRPRLRAVGYPLAFLALLAPLPEGCTAALEHGLQHASALAANELFDLVGTPVYSASDLSLQLPGITLEVAPECSGLRSTLALFVVSLPAGYVFLDAWWARLLVTLAVIPLGVLRNAVRIVTIGELCVHVGPQMIDAYLHRHGGWIFFLISLLPLFLLLAGLARWEHRRRRSPHPSRA